jgi:hypothetical protein
MSRRQAANGSLLPKSRALFARDLYANSLSLVSDDLSKNLRLDASQLNRLGTADSSPDLALRLRMARNDNP